MRGHWSLPGLHSNGLSSASAPAPLGEYVIPRHPGGHVPVPGIQQTLLNKIALHRQRGRARSYDTVEFVWCLRGFTRAACEKPIGPLQARLPVQNFNILERV